MQDKLQAITLIQALEAKRAELNASLTTQTDLTERDEALLEGMILGLIFAKAEILRQRA